MNRFQSRYSALACGALAAGSALGQPDVTLEYIGAGGSGGINISEAGQVVFTRAGESYDDLYRFTDGVGLERLDLGAWMMPSDPVVNSAGQVGFTGVWNGATHAARYSDGLGVEGLDTLGSEFGFVRGINDAGQVVGQALTPSAGVAFRFSDGVGMVDLGTFEPGVSRGSAAGINARGQVTGSSEMGGGVTRAFRYTDGVGVEDIGTLGGRTTMGRDINNNGDVFGYAIDSDGDGRHFLYTDDGGMRDIGSIYDMFMADMNDARWIVGHSGLTAMLWTEETGMFDLNSLLPSGVDAKLASALAINNANQVVGLGQIDGEWGVYRLTIHDIPGASTVAVLAMGTVVVMRRRR